MPLKHGDLSKQVLVAFFDVYNELGTGFLESVYRAALAAAIRDSGLQVTRETPIDVHFRGAVIGRFYADIVVEDLLIVEVKAVPGLLPAHLHQLHHYLRSTAIEVGLLVNFGPSPQFKRRVLSNSNKSSIPQD